MTPVHGRAAAVSLDGRSLGAYTSSITFTRTAEAIDSTPWGARARVYLSGLKDDTAKLAGVYDSSISSGPGAIFRARTGGAVVDLVYQPEGTGTGCPTATISATIASYEESTPVADMVKWEAELQLSDEIFDGYASAAGDIYTPTYTTRYGAH